MNEEIKKEDEVRKCPKCGSEETAKFLRAGDAYAPECWFWMCGDCNHQFDIG